MDTAPTTTAPINPSMLSQTPAEANGIPSLHAGVTPATSATTTPSTGKKSTGTASSSSTNPTVAGLRQRVTSLGNQLDSATDHPAVKNAKVSAQKQIGQFREVLGRSQNVRSLEQRTGVDRVLLVVGGIFAYILLIPLNLLGLALPVTTLLTLVPPSILAFNILDRTSGPSDSTDDAATKALLSYFVVLGFIQFLESLAAGVLARRIPQYYTLKLLVLAYLIHPKTRGAIKLHQQVFRPLFIRNKAATPVTTPPTTKTSESTASSPTGGPISPPGTAFDGDGQGNVTKGQAVGEAFEVVSEQH